MSNFAASWQAQLVDYRRLLDGTVGRRQGIVTCTRQSMSDLLSAADVR